MGPSWGHLGAILGLSWTILSYLKRSWSESVEIVKTLKKHKVFDSFEGEDREEKGEKEDEGEGKAEGEGAGKGAVQSPSWAAEYMYRSSHMTNLLYLIWSFSSSLS